MRAVVQRVTRAQVTVNGEVTGRIDQGLVVLLGVEREDTADDVEYLSRKVCELRVFEDETGRMNRTLAEAGGRMLVVSQFTLLADCRKGRRPSFDAAAPPDVAQVLYEDFLVAVRGRQIAVETGRFQQHMLVELVNEGPVTLLLDSRRTF